MNQLLLEESISDNAMAAARVCRRRRREREWVRGKVRSSHHEGYPSFSPSPWTRRGPP
jgi:hypothetical protein